MATPSSSSPDPGATMTTIAPGDTRAEATDARLAFRTAFAHYQTAMLLSIVGARSLESDAARPTTLAADLTAQLDSPSAVAELLAGLSAGARQALCLFALLETPVWPLAGLTHALATLGVEPRPVILDLLRAAGCSPSKLRRESRQSTTSLVGSSRALSLRCI